MVNVLSKKKFCDSLIFALVSLSFLAVEGIADEDKPVFSSAGSSSGGGISPGEPQPAGPQSRENSSGVVVYTSRNCGFCVKLQDLLEKNGIPYEKIEIKTAQDVKTLEEKSGKRTVPQVFVNGVHKGSYTDLFMADMFGKLRETLGLSQSLTQK